MSDIRFNQWLHQSGTGGVSQVASGAVGVGTTNPLADFYVRGDAQITGILTAGHIAMGSSITFGDNDRIYLGDGTDFQLYHNSTDNNSYLVESGAGSLVVNASALHVKNAANNEDIAKFTQSGNNELYFSNSKKFETTNTGVLIVGICTATSFSGSGATLTALNASNLSSGTVNVARLGSGASNTKFLRGDNTWQTVSGGGGATDKISEGNTEVETVDTGSDGHIKFTTEGTERARIDSSGITTFRSHIQMAPLAELRWNDNDGKDWKIDTENDWLNIEGVTSGSKINIQSKSDGLFLGDSGQQVIHVYGGGGGGIYFHWNGSQKLKLENGNWTYTNGATVTHAADVLIPDKLVHVGDTNTSLRFPAADTITAETAGTERLRITGIGSVGIGTDDPEHALVVRDSGLARIRIRNDVASSGNYASVNLKTAGFDGGWSLYSEFKSSNADNYLKIFKGDGTGTHMYFKDKDEVGIRSSFYHVDGNGANQGDSCFGFVANTANPGFKVKIGGTERFRIDSSGRAMIGVMDTSHASGNADDLCVGNNDSSSEHGITIGSNVAGGIRWADSASGSAGLIEYVHSNDRMVFVTNGSERLRITTDGTLGLNGLSPGSSDETVAIQEPSGGSAAAVTLSHLSGGNRHGCKFETLSGATQGVGIFTRFNSSYTEKLRIQSDKVMTTVDIKPNADGTLDLGASGARWDNVFINDLDLSNESKKDAGGNDVDGTWGSYVIQEGENDLFLINKRNGKKYKFNLTEVS